MATKKTIGTSATLVSDTVNRNWCYIRNIGAVDIHISFDGDSGVTNDSGNFPGHKLAAGEWVFSPAVATHIGSLRKPIYAVATGSSCEIAYQES